MKGDRSIPSRLPNTGHVCMGDETNNDPPVHPRVCEEHM
jgi:hypothetical protein